MRNPLTLRGLPAANLALGLIATGTAAAGTATASTGHHENQLQPGQLIVCSSGAHSDLVIDTLTTASDTPTRGATVITLERDTCRTVVDVPDGAYPIDGTYRIRLQGFKERPPGCESPVGYEPCALPFHHVEIRHADKAGATNIDEPDVTVTISSRDGVQVDFVHLPDYGPIGRR